MDRTRTKLIRNENEGGAENEKNVRYALAQ